MQGSMVLKVEDRGEVKDIEIKEGEIFLLPGRFPHSPQRKAGTVGLVLERERSAAEIDGLRWYARDGSSKVLYEEWFHCTDLGVQLKPVIERFFAMDCYKTGVPDREFPAPPYPMNTSQKLVMPFSLKDWIEAEAKPHGRAVLFGAGAVHPDLRDMEYSTVITTGKAAAGEGEYADWTAVPAGEVFFYQLEGSCTLQVKEIPRGDGSSSVAAAATAAGGDGSQAVQMQTITLSAGDVLLVPCPADRAEKTVALKAVWSEDATCMIVSNKVAY